MVYWAMDFLSPSLGSPWPGTVFILASLPLVHRDLKDCTVPPLPLGIAGISVFLTRIILVPSGLTEAVLAFGLILLGGGLLWSLSQGKFGLGDVTYLGVMSLGTTPLNLYFILTWACVAGFSFYLYYLIRGRETAGLALPFLPVLWLSYIWIEVPHWL